MPSSKKQIITRTKSFVNCFAVQTGLNTLFQAAMSAKCKKSMIGPLLDKKTASVK